MDSSPARSGFFDNRVDGVYDNGWLINLNGMAGIGDKDIGLLGRKPGHVVMAALYRRLNGWNFFLNLGGGSRQR